MTDRFDDPGTALSPQGSARPRLRFVPAPTLSIGVTVKVPTPEGQEVSGEANPQGGNFLAAGSVAFTGTQSDGTRHPPWPPDHHRSHLAQTYPQELDYVPPIASFSYPDSGLIAGDRGGLVRTWLLVIAMAWFAVGLVVALIAPEFSVVIVVAVVVLLIPLTFAAAGGPVTTTAARLPDHACTTSSPVSSRRRLVRAEPGDGGAQVGGSANSPHPLPSLLHTSHNPRRQPVLGNTQVPVQPAPNPFGEAQ